MHAYCGHSVMVAVMVTDGDGDHDGHGDGGAGDVSSYLAQFSVPTAYHYTHPAHMRAAHSAAQVKVNH